MLHLEDHHEGRVVLATIDRPHRRNAVDHSTLVALGDALEDAVARDCRVFVLTGAGGSFSAGADLTGVEGEEFTGALRRALTLLAEAPLVTMAGIEGHALGAPPVLDRGPTSPQLRWPLPGRATISWRDVPHSWRSVPQPSADTDPSRLSGVRLRLA